MRKRRKGIYILPNLFTLAALFGGFYAVVMAMNGRFDLAAVGVFCAMVLDSLDGRVARMTNTQSAFGEQMDSLSDMVSFGAAPAPDRLRMGAACLGRWGWIAAFVYCACRAAAGPLQREHGRGRQALLPGPAVAGGRRPGRRLHLAHDRLRREGYDVTWIMFAVALYAGLTMVTNVPFYSFKDIQMKRACPSS